MSPAPFVVHEGVAAPLRIDNIDTDQIIPSREMRTVSQKGLGEGLFAGWRYQHNASREPDPEFVLNKPEYRGATVLIAGANFGCGSSREHAVWALAEYGIRAIVAESFGEIFYENCARNGILAISAPKEEIEGLWIAIEKDPQKHRVILDLRAQTIKIHERLYSTFEIDPYQKALLLEGLDPISLTLLKSVEILAYLDRDRRRRPWLYRRS